MNNQKSIRSQKQILPPKMNFPNLSGVLVPGDFPTDFEYFKQLTDFIVTVTPGSLASATMRFLNASLHR